MVYYSTYECSHTALAKKSLRNSVNLILIIAIPIIAAIFLVGITQTLRDVVAKEEKSSDDNNKHSSESDDKISEQTQKDESKSVNPNDSDIIPITDPTAIVTPTISQAVGQPCPNTEDKTCTATVAPNTTTTPTTTTTTTTPPITNSVTSEDNSGSNSGTTSSGGSGGSSSSSDEQNDREVTNSDRQDNNKIDDASRYILVQQGWTNFYV